MPSPYPSAPFLALGALPSTGALPLGRALVAALPAQEDHLGLCAQDASSSLRAPGWDSLLMLCLRVFPSDILPAKSPARSQLVHLNPSG
ncbi:hypothetical protein ColKHC_11973 [Colletotrichum higginsianum]|nr:hypothetical protein ColKHC_11973 [Colletotrichum higginsianum]